MSKLESLGAPVALIAPVAKLRAATPGESRRAATPGNEGIPERNIMKRYSSFHLSFVSKSKRFLPKASGSGFRFHGV